MVIQEGLPCAVPVDAGGGEWCGPGARRDRRDTAGTRSIDAMRVKVRLGFYLKKEVLDQVIDALLRE